MRQTVDFLKQRLRPLKYPAFRTLFAVQGVSLVGTWMQELARSWIVLNLMGKASSIGFLMLGTALPNILLVSRGGVAADKRGARSILIWTQVLFSMLAFALAGLVSSGHIKFWHLVGFALVEGTILAFDMPAYQLVTPQLVPKEDFQQALALNAVNFHLSRMIGPTIAGLVMGVSGPSTVFWINGLSFIGVVWAVTRLPLARTGSLSANVNSRDAFRESLTYVKSNPLILAILIQVMLIAGIVFPLMFTTLRVHLQQGFGLSAKQYGLAFAAPGFGALIGSLTFLFSNPKAPLKLVPWSVAGIVLSLCGIAEAHSLPATIAFMTAFSLGIFLTMSALTTTIQLMIEHRMRGRISAFTGIAFAALSPIMATPVGFLSDWIGNRTMMLAAAALFGVTSAVVGIKGLRTEANVSPISD